MQDLGLKNEEEDETYNPKNHDKEEKCSKHDAIAFELGLAQNLEEDADDHDEILWDNEDKNNINENIWGLTLPQDRASLMRGLITVEEENKVNYSIDKNLWNNEHNNVEWTTNDEVIKFNNNKKDENKDENRNEYRNNMPSIVGNTTNQTPTT